MLISTHGTASLPSRSGVKGGVLFSEPFALHEPQSMVYGIQHTTDLPAHSFPHSPLCSDNPSAACVCHFVPLRRWKCTFWGGKMKELRYFSFGRLGDCGRLAFAINTLKVYPEGEYPPFFLGLGLGILSISSSCFM